MTTRTLIVPLNVDIQSLRIDRVTLVRHWGGIECISILGCGAAGLFVMCDEWHHLRDYGSAKVSSSYHWQMARASRNV